MKKGRAAALVAIAVASAAALSLPLLLLTAEPPAGSPEPPAPPFAAETPPPDLLPPQAPLRMPEQHPSSDQPSIRTSSPSATYESAVNDFAFDLYRAVSANEKGKNLFFSPASIHTAFSVLYEGARGNTAQQLLDAFRFEQDSGARHDAAASAAASIGRGDGTSELSLANALWLSTWFAPYDTYLEAARGAYGATVDTVDFTDESDAVPRINAWASKNTNEKIEKVIAQDDVDDLTAMVITNAIYFKGLWAAPFPGDSTRTDTFTREDGSTALADFMEVTAELDYASYDGYQVLRMPYEGGRLSMLVVLPGDPGGLGRLADGLSDAALAGWIAGADSREVRVVMPKFKVETRYDLENILKPLGVTDAFDDDRADLTGIGESMKGKLYVYKASHDAYVAVDEKGTEAAAVTTAIVAPTSAERPPPTNFIADRPFLFVIHDDETGAILFMGRLADPTGGP